MNNIDYKSLTKEELEYIFSDIDFPLEPMRHQYISLAFGSSMARVSLLLDVGTGKTLCSLYLARLWGCKKILVICPASAFGSWRRDLRDNTNFTYSFITGSGRERKCELENEKDVHIITYVGLKTVYAKLYRGKGWQVQDSSFIHNFDGIIVDEDHKCANHESLQSEICYKLSRRAKYVIGMTGTLIDKSYLELFHIYKVIDLGKSLGTNFYAYRYRHFDKKVCGRKWGRQWIEWELKPGHEQEILDRISGVSISFSREECFDLPPIQPIFKFIHPSKQFLQLQEDIIKGKPLHFSGKKISKIKDKAFALRELPSGFVYYGKDKQVFRLKKNPKAEALIDLFEDSSSKIIVFYWFVEERDIISKALRKAKIPFCSAFGGQNLLDREKEIDKFQKDENVRGLISQVTVANEGYDAYAANVVVFFSPLGSPKMRKQCIGRTQRPEQKCSVLVIDFVMEDSIEEQVIVNRGPRFNLVKETMAYIRDFHSGGEVEE